MVVPLVVPSRGRVAVHLQSQAVLAGSPEPRVPFISSSRRGDMEWFGRNPVGSIRGATTPTSGGHELGRARTGLRPSRFSSRLGQAADLAVAKAVVDEDEKFAGRSDAPDLGAAALADVAVVRRDGRVASLVRHRLDGGPAHKA